MLVVRDVTSRAARDGERARSAESWRRRLEDSEAALAKLRTLHEELEARRADAERLNQELQRLDGMKSDLLANVSHELQTPLVSIRGYTEMILKGRLGPINDEQKQGLALSLRNIDRLITMIDNLLAFARMDREAGALKLESFPLAAVVDEAQALLRERIEARGLHVERRIAEPGLSVRADRDKILQVFVNLLSNAVKFNRDRGTIQVDVQRGKPGFALVHVRDTGVGIAREDLEKIFDRFYQAGDRAGESGKDGTGIGLAIVRNILRSHGCVIHATSAPGEGTTFSFTLPLVVEQARAGERRASPETVAPPQPPRRAPAQEDARAPRLRIIRR
jgi:signal transduction histidine kinase